jgi:hypothetical protein
MYEEIRSLRGKPLQELARLDLVIFKALELSHHPGHEHLVNVLKQGIILCPPVFLGMETARTGGGK